MFYHTKKLQYEAKPSKPNALFANKVQEVLGGQYGEMTVMTQYLFQGWSCSGPAKYKDMLLDIGTEEIGHVEMLCTMIARLLEGAPLSEQEAAMQSNPILAAIIGGSNPQHSIVGGGGPRPTDSMGNPWTGGYVTNSGNLFANFQANLNAEVNGRLQVCRLYEMTDDPGIRDTFQYMIARDTMHQNQWMAALEDMKAEGLDGYPVPMTFTADSPPWPTPATSFGTCPKARKARKAAGPPGRRLTAKANLCTWPIPSRLRRSRICRRPTPGCTTCRPP